MKIYGANLSPFVRKVLAVCSIKGLEFEHEVVLPGQLPEGYLRISPLGKIPALEDGNLAVSDSSVICEYLEEKYPAIPVLPASAEERARSRWLEEYGDSRFVEAVGPFFFEHVLKRIMQMGEPDTARLEQLAAEVIPGHLEYLEGQVPADGFLFGEIGIADLGICSPLITASYGGFELDGAQYPKIAGLLQRVKSHPALVPVLAADAAMLEGMGG